MINLIPDHAYYLRAKDWTVVTLTLPREQVPKSGDKVLVMGEVELEVVAIEMYVKSHWYPSDSKLEKVGVAFEGNHYDTVYQLLTASR